MALQGWTHFKFKDRGGKYSDFEWTFQHFSGVDRDEKAKINAIFRIDGKNKGWALAVDHEDGNYDYLSESSRVSISMCVIVDEIRGVVGADIDHADPDARKELLKWGQWIVENTDHVGFRFDAIKVRAAIPSSDLQS